VFPNPNRHPTGTSETIVGIDITAPVLLNFRPPPVGVRLWPGSVRWAAMPEAPIDEHGNPGLREHQVRFPPNPWNRPTVNEKPRALAMEGRAQLKLALGVTSPLG
jgi:hypothetical protein